VACMGHNRDVGRWLRRLAALAATRQPGCGRNATMNEVAGDITAYLMDMDGVLVRGAQLIPGADEFIQRLRAANLPFLILTNNSMYTPRDLQTRLTRIGLHVMTEEIFTSALATAQFLQAQLPNGSAYVIGEAGLTTALHDDGFVLSDVAPEYVVL